MKQWEGFKAYLVDIKKYGNLAEAQEILDRYFSYAIALGVEETLLVQVNEWGGHAPAWLGDGQLNDGSAWHNRYDRRLHRRRWYQRGSFLPRQTQPKRPLPSNQTMSKPRPSLQAVSDNLTRSLNRASDNMTELLNTAVGEGKTQKLSIIAFGRSRDVNWDEASSINTIINNVMSQGQSIRPPQPRSSSSSSSSESGRSGGSSSWGSSSSSRRSSSRSRSRRSSRSSSRRSSSRRSGGGGRRGFK